MFFSAFPRNPYLLPHLNALQTPCQSSWAPPLLQACQQTALSLAHCQQPPPSVLNMDFYVYSPELCKSTFCQWVCPVRKGEHLIDICEADCSTLNRARLRQTGTQTHMHSHLNRGPPADACNLVLIHSPPHSDGYMCRNRHASTLCHV